MTILAGDVGGTKTRLALYERTEPRTRQTLEDRGVALPAGYPGQDVELGFQLHRVRTVAVGADRDAGVVLREQLLAVHAGPVLGVLVGGRVGAVHHHAEHPFATEHLQRRLDVARLAVGHRGGIGAFLLRHGEPLHPLIAVAVPGGVVEPHGFGVEGAQGPHRLNGEGVFRPGEEAVQIL